MRTIQKPWGQELILAESEKYALKRILIRAGESTSLHYHQRRDETLVVESGELLMRFNNPSVAIKLVPGNAIRIKPGQLHQLVAITDASILEVSTGQLDDVVRVSDPHGRVLQRS